MELVRQALSEENDVGLHNGLSIGVGHCRWINDTTRAQRDLLCHDLRFDFVAGYAVLATLARGRGERAVALDDTLDASLLFQCVDVLSVVAQKLVLLLQQPDEPVGRGILVSFETTV